MLLNRFKKLSRKTKSGDHTLEWDTTIPNHLTPLSEICLKILVGELSKKALKSCLVLFTLKIKLIVQIMPNLVYLGLRQK